MLIIFIGVLFVVSSCVKEKAKVCPDQWIVDINGETKHYEKTDENGTKAYLPKDLDLRWIENNCELPEPFISMEK